MSEAIVLFDGSKLINENAVLDPPLMADDIERDQRLEYFRARTRRFNPKTYLDEINYFERKPAILEAYDELAVARRLFSDEIGAALFEVALRNEDMDIALMHPRIPNPLLAHYVQCLPKLGKPVLALGRTRVSNEFQFDKVAPFIQKIFGEKKTIFCTSLAALEETLAISGIKDLVNSTVVVNEGKPTRRAKCISVYPLYGAYKMKYAVYETCEQQFKQASSAARWAIERAISARQS